MARPRAAAAMTPTSSAVLVLASIQLLCLAATFTLSIWLDRFAGTVRVPSARRACIRVARLPQRAVHPRSLSVRAPVGADAPQTSRPRAACCCCPGSLTRSSSTRRAAWPM